MMIWCTRTRLAFPISFGAYDMHAEHSPLHVFLIGYGLLSSFTVIWVMQQSCMCYADNHSVLAGLSQAKLQFR